MLLDLRIIINRIGENNLKIRNRCVNSKKLFLLFQIQAALRMMLKYVTFLKKLSKIMYYKDFYFFHMKQPEIETVALLYSYKFN